MERGKHGSLGRAERESSSLGQAWKGMARPQDPSPACLEHSRARQLLPRPGPHRTLKPGVCLEKPLHPHSPFLEIAVVG